ncbi:hypothetical protein [Klenkia brasiliensis]|uniref:hypothetical protein n=1 Tax=Klenkia brasiliensis TaxID=333142 RepID=UPI0010421FB5|nr:hypothetical protein [Klenkia brasiliensis]
MRDDLPPEVWTHANGTTTPHTRPTREARLPFVTSVEDPALHLADRTGWVEDLMRSAGTQENLDPAHQRAPGRGSAAASACCGSSDRVED